MTVAIDQGGDDKHTCGLTTDGRLRCWGDSNAGWVAGPNASPDSFTALDADIDTTCAVRTDGRLRCWGFGDLSGPNESTDSFTAVAVAMALPVAQPYVCGLKTDGHLRCWVTFSSGLDPGEWVTGPNASSETFGPLSSARIAPLLRFQRTAGFTVGWEDASGTAVSFDLRYRSAPRESGRFGPYLDWLTQTPATQAGFHGGFGRTTCFSVRAHDAAGDTSEWSTEQCTATPIDDGGLTQTGTWTLRYQHDAYLGHLLRATDVGSTLTTGTITGSRLALLVSRQPGGGTIEVRWNGTLLLTADLNAADVRNRQLIALPAFAGNETGQLEIRVSAPGVVDIDGVGVWKQPDHQPGAARLGTPRPPTLPGPPRTAAVPSVAVPPGGRIRNRGGGVIGTGSPVCGGISRRTIPRCVLGGGSVRWAPVPTSHGRRPRLRTQRATHP